MNKMKKVVYDNNQASKYSSFIANSFSYNFVEKPAIRKYLGAHLNKDVKVLDDEERIGVEIVKRAIVEPFRKLVENAGLDVGISLAKVVEATGNMGIDVSDGKLKYLVKAGVIDPVKVTRTALQNAASVAVMVMTTNVLISEKPEPPAPPPPPGMGGMEY